MGKLHPSFIQLHLHFDYLQLMLVIIISQELKLMSYQQVHR